MDIDALLRSLNARKARYLVIGATAFPIYGYARATLDLDLFIESTEENASRVRAALTDFGYDLTDVSVEELRTKKVLIRQYTLETDVHPFVKGITFEDAWARRVNDQIQGVPVAFASLDDLIRMKQAAGRPQDVEDVKALRKLK